MRILIVDDENGLRNSLKELLQDTYEVETAEDGEKALNLINEKSFEIVLSDLKMPKLDGLGLLKKIREVSPLTSFILMTAQGSIDGAVAAIQAGADDYIAKPVEFTELIHRLERIIELRAWHAQKSLIAQETKKTQLIGTSNFIAETKKFIDKVAAVQSPVLILGPSGTGKEVVAKSIHEAANNNDKAFVAVNCASLGENLIESELFGHEKGAFTGATSAKPGKFELAAGGTIFLDEIGELSLPLQAKLLRVLQEKEFCRVGGTRQIKSQARVIAATHRNLKEWVEKGLFREDLYFRLNVLQYSMTSLHQRAEDIPVLIEHYWNKISEELAIKSSLTPAAKTVLSGYHYPGNVRELKNVIERLIVLTPETGRVDLAQLPSEIAGTALTPVNAVKTDLSADPNSFDPPVWKPGQHLESYLEHIESEIVHRAFEMSGQNQVQAAELLGLNRGTFQYKIKKHDLGKKKSA
jgi:DNA-binding NtrC family response regulator